MNFAYLVWRLVEEVAGAAEVHEPSIFGINPGVSAWTLIIFLLLMAVLAKFAFPPILGYAAAREERIQKALDEARAQREEAEQLLEHQRAELAQARLDAQQLIAEGKQAAERVRADVLERARLDQEELLARARAEIEGERDRAVESLRREAVELALAAAARLIGQRVDADEDRKLVTEYLRTTPTPGGAAGAGAA